MKTDFEMIAVEVLGKVAVVKLNRPQVMNAINEQMGNELYEAFKEIELNRDIRAAVLCGEGRAFCAGQDLGAGLDLAASAFNLTDVVRERYNLLIAKMQSLPIPIVAAVQGAAVGAGFGLALASDLRTAATTASFAMAFSKIGLAPDSGCSYFLARLIGTGRTLELSWTGETVSAEQAHRLGIVNKLFNPDELLTETLKYADYLANGPTVAYGLTKQLVYENYGASLTEALDREARYQNVAGHTRDFVEGVTAFLQKRRPTYEGR